MKRILFKLEAFLTSVSFIIIILYIHVKVVCATLHLYIGYIQLPR